MTPVARIEQSSRRWGGRWTLFPRLGSRCITLFIYLAESPIVPLRYYECRVANEMTNESTTIDVPSDMRPEQIWKSLSDAVEHWGDHQHVAELRRLGEMGYSEETELAHVLRCQTKQDRLLDPFCNLIDRLREDLLDKLRAGSLVSTGFNPANQSDVPRRQIHFDLWRTLKPDFSDNSAQGGGLHIFDILVTTSEQAPELVFDQPRLVLSDNMKSVRYDSSSEIKLQPRTYQLLHLLASRAIARNPIVSANEIYRTIFAEGTSSNAVRDLVRELRRMLKPLDAATLGARMLIETRNQQGYLLRLTADQVSIEA